VQPSDVPGAAPRSRPSEQPAGPGSELPARIADRYLVEELLGKGGMAAVYRVRDAHDGAVVALKQLLPIAEPKRRQNVEHAFEREFHALAQLSHPRVIAVHDYGVDRGGAYYTMELLDGGDLREHAPLPWREACARAFDVCSSLALLHSRGLIHRDVSPRNVRCTRDGTAKLIDFGALSAFGGGQAIVGTPAFVAPEVVRRGTLDGRADLFSLGATLYHALCGRSPYPVRDFGQLIESWSRKPLPVTSLVPDVPNALEALIAALVSLEPESRPRTAFEVMERLSAIAELARDEPLSVQQAYLQTPMLVGRGEATASARLRIERALAGSGGGLVIRGSAGSGRSRMLDACILEAKTLGASVLYARAEASGGEPLALAQQLCEQLCELHASAAHASAIAQDASRLFRTDEAGEPRLIELARSELPRTELQTALVRWLADVARVHPLLIAVDNLERVDEPSAALLARLASELQRRALLVVATVPSGPADERSPAIAVLEEAGRSLDLLPLTEGQTQELLGSVFGDVPNLGFVSAWIDSIARGNPRACMDLAQHLVDQQQVSYRGGRWSLPVSLDGVALPASTEEVLRARLHALSPLARSLAQAQALALTDAFGREHYLRLAEPDGDSAAVDAALTELLTHQVLVGDVQRCAIAHGGWVTALAASMSDDRRASHHLALAAMHGQAEDERSALFAVHHLLSGGATVLALDRLALLLAAAVDRELAHATGLPAGRLVALLEPALHAAVALGRPVRELAVLRHRLVLLSLLTGGALFYRVAPAWRAQLIHDAGLDLYAGLHAIPDRSQRLTQAYANTAERHAATPEAERGYRPDEAIRLLVFYVVGAITAGSTALDRALLASLQGLIEPFVAISPLIAATWHNAAATDDAACTCRFEQARAGWLRGVSLLSTVTGPSQYFADAIRMAVGYVIGLLEARHGLAGASRWLELLERDPYQRVNALYLRRIMRLQQGDWDGAERLRKQAEVLALQSNSSQVSWGMFAVELAAAAQAGDVTNLRSLTERIAKHAARWPGWRQYALLAEGQLQRTCGNYAAACDALERCLLLCRPDSGDPNRVMATWPAATAAYVETLCALGRGAEALAVGRTARAECERLELGLASHEIIRALAVAQAQVERDCESAARELDALIEEQKALGVSGLHLGASYEARTRVAIQAEDRPGIARFGALTAREYRHGSGSALGARYERLMDEASRGGLDQPLPALLSMQSTSDGESGTISAAALVAHTLHSATDRDMRATRGLRLIVETCDARSAYLYLHRNGSLELAAAHAAPAPTGELTAFVRSFATREALPNAEATVVVEATDVFATIETAWADTSGLEFRPLLLTCEVEDQPVTAGVLVLAWGDPQPRLARAALLARALAAHLLRLRDATALDTGDSL